jgi:transposase-like protein
MDTSTQSAAKHTSRSGARRLRTIEEKRRIVEETFHSDESVAMIARRHEVNANLVFSWRRLYQKGLLEPVSSKAALLPVRIASRKAAVKRADRCGATVAATALVNGDCVEIELGAGKCMRVRGKLALQLLDRIIAELCAR